MRHLHPLNGSAMLALLPLLAMGTVPASASIRVVRSSATAASARPLPVRLVGRAEATDDGSGDYLRQWPGTYAETAFHGRAALFRIGAGEARLHVLVDGRPVQTLVKPAPGTYRVEGLAAGRHVLRIEVASESQAGPTRFGGFFAPAGTTAARLAAPSRQIDFIGDSHTVGYGNTSTKRDCTQDEVWATTDTSQAFGPLLAKRYGADYEVNAISGRGVVRNYDGFAADTVPEAYPFTLFDRKERVDQPGWHPQVIVIALGTNDFTTPLHDGEQWKTRDDLHADYEATYVRFVRALHDRDPGARFVLWATEMANGEIEAETHKVAEKLRTSGDVDVTYVPVNGLSFTACHGHPSIADERVIADKIAAAIEAQPHPWQ